MGGGRGEPGPTLARLPPPPTHSSVCPSALPSCICPPARLLVACRVLGTGASRTDREGPAGVAGQVCNLLASGPRGAAASRQGRLAGDLGNLRPIAHRSPGSATAPATALAPVTARHGPGPCPSPCRRPAQPQSDSPGPGPSSYPVRGPRHAGPGRLGRHEAHLPGRLPQELGAVPVSVVLGQVGRGVAVLVPQGVVHVVGDQGLAALRGGGACDRGTRPCPRLSPAPCTRSPSPPPRGDTEAARAGAREPTPRHGHPVLAAWRSALRTPVRGLHRSPGPAARASPSRPGPRSDHGTSFRFYSNSRVCVTFTCGKGTEQRPGRRWDS